MLHGHVLVYPVPEVAHTGVTILHGHVVVYPVPEVAHTGVTILHGHVLVYPVPEEAHIGEDPRVVGLTAGDHTPGHNACISP